MDSGIDYRLDCGLEYVLDLILTQLWIKHVIFTALSSFYRCCVSSVEAPTLLAHLWSSCENFPHIMGYGAFMANSNWTGLWTGV